MPFLLAMLIGVVAAVPLGVLFALPAVRTRGINLAIVTLGLGTTIELMLFRNREYTGGVAGHAGRQPVDLRLRHRVDPAPDAVRHRHARDVRARRPRRSPTSDAAAAAGG